MAQAARVSGWPHFAFQDRTFLLVSRPTDFSAIASDTLRLSSTLLIAFATGWLFRHAGVPAPYLLGGLFGVWFSGRMIAPLRTRMGIPRWFHVPVILGVGVLIGTSFQPEVLSRAAPWSASMLAMGITTIFATLAGFFWLTRLRSYPPELALLGCIPGGQAEIISAARDLVEKDYVVALFHLVRVTLIFCLMPLLLALFEGQEAVIHSNDMLMDLPRFSALTAGQFTGFVGLAVGGYFLARLLHLPMPHMLGPMGISIIVHITGWMALPRVNEFVIIAQLAIGGGVGARLAEVPFAELASYLRDAIINAVLILVIYSLIAGLMAWILNQPPVSVWLAFVPGGFYEVTLLALLFGYDIAFASVHQSLRVMMIFFALPWIINWAAGSAGKDRMAGKKGRTG